MVKAAPVTKEHTELNEITSTIQPHRASPKKQIIPPEITERAEAMMWPGISGFESLADNTMSPTNRDMTATGCENQYNYYYLQL